MSMNYYNGDGTMEIDGNAKECQTCGGSGEVHIKSYMWGKEDEIIDEDEYYKLEEGQDDMTLEELDKRGFIVEIVDCPECNGDGFFEIYDPREEFEYED